MAQDDPAVFDADAIQAQIDLAMSMTDDIVSGWMKPTASGSEPSSKSALVQKKKTFEETERELEAYMRRPPRLGVGAPTPDAGGPGTREAMALRNKIGGNSKKRNAEKASTSAPNGVNGVSDEEDEEDEKKGSSGSNSKKTRTDPFSTPKKKAKQIPQSTPAQQQQPTPSTLTSHDTTITVNGVAAADTPAGKVDDPPTTSGLRENGGVQPPPLPEKKKKKKKKRKQDLANGNGVAHDVPTSDRPSLSVDFSSMRANGLILSPLSSTSQASTANVTNEVESSNEYDDEEEWTGFSMSIGDDDDDDGATESAPVVLPSNALSTPLLNLNGPPPEVDDDSIGEDRTPRKRTRKKKRKATELDARR